MNLFLDEISLCREGYHTYTAKYHSNWTKTLVGENGRSKQKFTLQCQGTAWNEHKCDGYHQNRVQNNP